MSLRRWVTAAAAAVLVTVPVAAADAAVGDRDPEFNGGNPVTLRVPTTLAVNSARAAEVVTDRNGRSVVGGVATQGASLGATTSFGMLARVSPNGTLDTSFDLDGYVTARGNEGNASTSTVDVGLDPQSRLVSTFNGDTRAFAARYVGNGALDEEYGSLRDGDQAPVWPDDNVYTPEASAVGPDGSTYFVASVPIFNTGAETAIRVLRLDPDGIRDDGYGQVQTVRRERAPGQDAPWLATVDDAGRLYVVRGVAAAGGDATRVTRFTASGRIDTSWGTGSAGIDSGSASLTRSGSDLLATDAQLGPDGTIWVTGSASGTGTFLFHVRADGQLDTTFGDKTPITAQRTMAVAVDAQNRPIVGGASFHLISPTGTDYIGSISLTRYTTTGALDPTFSGDGRVGEDVPGTGGPLQLEGMAVTRQGGLLVTGTETLGQGRSRGILLRYLLTDPSLAPTLRSAPVLSGTPVVGGQLACGAGQWTNNPAVTVVWERAPRTTSAEDDPAWGAVAGAGRTYTVTPEDAGSRLRCREVATNVNGSDTAPSNTLRADVGVPALVRRPTIAGVPVVGQSVSCDRGEWSNGPDLRVAWLRDGLVIDGAEGREYGLVDADRRHRITCQVSASNDVGAAAAPERASNDALVVRLAPVVLEAPSIALATTGARATDQRLTCGTGRWDEDYGSYEYRWEREGAEIAGAVGSTYDATVADLGRVVRCVAYSTNPAGRSDGARSATVLVPLPATGEKGIIYTAGAFNRLDPANFMAVTQAWKNQIKGLVQQRRRAALTQLIASCRTGEMASQRAPDFTAYLKRYPGGVYMSTKDTCGVLNSSGEAEVVLPDGSGAKWVGGFCRYSDSGVNIGFGAPCPSLRLKVPVLNAATPPAAISSLEQASLDAVKPVAVLWDFDSDGRTDASCDPNAPIVRTLPSRGIYKVRAVIVSADSAETGLYSISDLDYRFFPESDSQKGQLRGAQPFACKTSLIPPEDPAQPCVNEANIGRTHVTGNICPVSARRVPESDLGGLPPDVRKLLEAQAFAGPLRKTAALQPERLPMDANYGFRATPGSLPYVTTTQVSALSTLANEAGAAEVQKGWETRLKQELPEFKLPEAQYAMDQVYLIRGQAKVNGVDFNPRNGALTVMVPSDAGQALNSIKKMTLSNRDVQLALGGVPIGKAEALATDLQDQAKGYGEQLLKATNFDQLAKDLAKKLDLGPFKLAGDGKVKLQKDGTALIEAQAELKGAFKVGSGPIRTGVTIRATQAGKLSLEGIRLAVPKALLGAVSISGLDLRYNGGGLDVQGKLLFPPVNEGIAINRFRTTAQGEFQELDVSYLAGAGQGINVGPGIFLVKLGGGLSLNPDEVRARAGLSIGPSPGGGCPTAGMDADMNVHFGPGIFFVQANSTVQLICIPIANTKLYVDQTGAVDLSAALNLDLGPIYVNAGFGGMLRLPRWQVDVRGKGGIRSVFSGQVKALLGNLGLAGCGRVEVFPETPFTDSVTIAGGAGVRFSNGRPPLAFPELIANLRIFSGCSLTSWSPFGRDVASAAQAGGGRTFELPRPAPAVQALELIGAGGSPRVKLTKPDGTVVDASAVGEELTKGAQVSGLRDEARDRTVLFVRGAPGTWRVQPVDGSPALVDLRHAEVLPAPKVTAKVGGAGASRVLRYRVARVPGQVVTFVEQSDRGLRSIRTVKNGGRGTVRFLTSEGRGTKRRVIAQVVQDGMPRDNLTVARFSAPAPAVARPRVRVRRRGSKVAVTWRKTFYASRYEVSVRTGRGRSFLLTPGRKRTAAFRGLAKGEGAVVRVVALSPAGRRGRAGVARVKGGLRVTSGPKRDRWDRAKAQERKRARKRVKPRRGLG